MRISRLFSSFSSQRIKKQTSKEVCTPLTLFTQSIYTVLFLPYLPGFVCLFFTLTLPNLSDTFTCTVLLTLLLPVPHIWLSKKKNMKIISNNPYKMGEYFKVFLQLPLFFSQRIHTSTAQMNKSFLRQRLDVALPFNYLLSV